MRHALADDLRIYARLSTPRWPVTRELRTPNANPSLMRAMNAAGVVTRLREKGPLSRAELGRLTGLSKPTITSVVAYLEEVGYVEEVARTDGYLSSDVRRPQLYGFKATSGYVISFDIGADKLLMMLGDLNGNVVARRRVNIRRAARRGPSAVFVGIAQMAGEILAEAGLDMASVRTVVAGTPGVVSPDGVVTLAPQLPAWEGIDLRTALSDIFPCSVHVEREVSLSLLAERWVGVATGIDDALFINLGVGVGAALLIDGQICRGADGGAGEIGAMPLEPGRPSTSSFGPFESATGGVAFAAQGQAAAKTKAGKRILELAGGKDEAIDAAVVFAAAREGDPAAVAIVNRAVEVLAWGISCLVCAFNPHTVVIGGGMSRAADLMIDALQRQVAAAVPFPPKWLVSTMGEDAVALGGLRRATENLEHDLFLSAEALAAPLASVRSH
jgi:predicted NBD/HSP70 family sugar kinase